MWMMTGGGGTFIMAVQILRCAHLRAVAAAAEGGVCGPDGLRGGAAVDLGVDGAVAYWWTVIVCKKKPMNGYLE